MANRRNMRSARRMMMRRKKRRQFLFCFLLACIFLIWMIIYLSMRGYVSKYPENRVCENIYVGPVSVSGMTEKEVVKELEEHLEDDNEIKVVLKVGKKTAKTTLGKLGIEFKNIEKLAKKAVAYGKSGTVWERFRKIRKLSKEKMVMDKQIIVDKKKAGSVFKKKTEPIIVHAKNASIEKSGTGFSIVEEKEGKTIDIAKSIAVLETYLNTEWEHNDFSLSLVQKKEHPSVRAKDLETITDELGSFSTDAGGGERWKNLKTGAQKLDGIILMPGEEVSAHELTAPYDEEHGYVPAGSYENGQVVDTYGGGICQVTTTLYNALLYSELEITKRYPHSMVVNYVEPSRDAAIAGDIKDLKFKNNYDTPVCIFGEIDASNQLRFSVYGKDTRKKGREVKLESETLTTEEYGVTYKVNSEAALGSMNAAGSPHTGKEAQLWKIIYQDGEEVSREVVNKSYYKKSDQIIEVGTKSSNGEASSIVAAAVATQDKEKIQAAISEAAGML